MHACIQNILKLKRSRNILEPKRWRSTLPQRRCVHSKIGQYATGKSSARAASAVRGPLRYCKSLRRRDVSRWWRELHVEPDRAPFLGRRVWPLVAESIPPLRRKSPLFLDDFRKVFPEHRPGVGVAVDWITHRCEEGLLYVLKRSVDTIDWAEPLHKKGVQPLARFGCLRDSRRLHAGRDADVVGLIVCHCALNQESEEGLLVSLDMSLKVQLVLDLDQALRRSSFPELICLLFVECLALIHEDWREVDHGQAPLHITIIACLLIARSFLMPSVVVSMNTTTL